MEFEGKYLGVVKLSENSYTVVVNTLSPIIYEFTTSEDGKTVTNQYFKPPAFDGKKILVTQNHIIFQVESADYATEGKRDSRIFIYKRKAAGGSSHLYWQLETQEEVRLAAATCIDDEGETCLFATETSANSNILLFKTSPLTISTTTSASFWKLSQQDVKVHIKGLADKETSVELKSIIAKDDEPTKKDDEEPDHHDQEERPWYKNGSLLLLIFLGLIVVSGILGLIAYKRKGPDFEDKAYVSASFYEHDQTMDDKREDSLIDTKKSL